MRNISQVTVLCGALALAMTPTQSQALRQVEVDGRTMRVRTAGTARADRSGPVVVFESGLDTSLESWDSVFDDVAKLAPVVAYDRAGIGQSAPDGQVPTPEHVARTLRGLLTHLGLAPPYVLVGHSWGGPLIRMFAARYPKDVAGLVFVDPTDMRTEAQALAFYEARGHARADVPALRQKRRERFRARGGEMKVALDLEDRYFAEFHALPPMPDVPVAVLMSARFDAAPWVGEPCAPRACHERWVELRRASLSALVRTSSAGLLTVTTAGGHFLQRDDPELVIWTIQRVLRSAAGRARPRQ